MDGIGERTPLHPGAVHKHTDEEQIRLYDGFDFKPYTGHLCWCGELWLIEAD